MIYWQKCPECGHISTPECEGHNCHECGKAKYENYTECKVNESKPEE